MNIRIGTCDSFAIIFLPYYEALPIMIVLGLLFFLGLVLVVVLHFTALPILFVFIVSGFLFLTA